MMNAEIRQQERLYRIEERDFRRGELPGKYTAKILYRQDDGKFEKKYLKKLERNQMRWKRKLISFSRSRNLEWEIMSDL